MIGGLKIERISMTSDARLRVMETAVDAGYTHGIGYWADIKKIKNLTLVDKPDEQRIGAMMILDREGGGEPDLTILGRNNALIPGGGQGKGGQLWLNGATIEKAVSRMLCDPQGTETEGWTAALLDYEYEDGPLADVIIQVACFGKVVYA